MSGFQVYEFFTEFRVPLVQDMPWAKDLTADGLIKALRLCLRPEIASAAQSLAFRIELYGARNAAERLLSLLQ